VKDVLFEPVRKTQDAMFFFKSPEGMWIPCGPKQQGAVQTTMTDLATKGLASQVFKDTIYIDGSGIFFFNVRIGEIEL
jgi:vacuolar protein-sorting-associated protein 4